MAVLSGILTEFDMAELQDALEAAMTERAFIRRGQRVWDGMGGYIVEKDADGNLPIIAHDVPVLRIAGIEGVSVTQQVGGQEVPGLRWELWMPHGTDVQEGDQVCVGGVAYEVIETASPATHMAGVLVYARRR